MFWLKLHNLMPHRVLQFVVLFKVTERVRIGLYLPDSNNVNSLTSLLLIFECLLAFSAVCFIL
jgi:hypothetical protein